MTYDIMCCACGIVVYEDLDPHDPRVDELVGDFCPKCNGRYILVPHEA